jgi:hypothetical protein
LLGKRPSLTLLEASQLTATFSLRYGLLLDGPDIQFARRFAVHLLVNDRVRL